MFVVFLACPVLIRAAWDDLSPKGAVGFLLIWAGLLAGFLGLTSLPGTYFVIGQVVIDIILLYIAYGDPRMRL